MSELHTGFSPGFPPLAPRRGSHFARLVVSSKVSARCICSALRLCSEERGDFGSRKSLGVISRAPTVRLRNARGSVIAQRRSRPVIVSVGHVIIVTLRFYCEIFIWFVAIMIVDALKENGGSFLSRINGGLLYF